MLEPDHKGVPTVLVTVGVDAHLDEHVAVALDHLGRRWSMAHSSSERSEG